MWLLEMLTLEITDISSRAFKILIPFTLVVDNGRLKYSYQTNNKILVKKKYSDAIKVEKIMNE